MIHHLNCATLRPWFGGRLVAHCLLVEREGGLLLIDSGLGTADLADSARLGRVWKGLMRPALDPAETAVEQVRALGFDPADVTDVLLTHLDFEQAGGAADFPQARIHVLDDELAAAREPVGKEHGRYLPEQWPEATFVTHTVGSREWFGFDGVAPLESDDVVLVALPGHSRGHAGVAVQRDDGRWLLHAGDAFFDATEVGAEPDPPRSLRALQRVVAIDHEQRLATAERLRELVAEHGDEVQVISAHSADQFDAVASAD